MSNPLTTPSHKNYSLNFVAFFLKAKLLTEALAAKGTSRSRNNVKKFKIPKNKLKKPELANPSTTSTYTVAISSIHSSVSFKYLSFKYLKINWKSQSDLM